MSQAVTGGIDDVTRDRGALRLAWQRRQLQFTLEARLTRQSQGSTKQDSAYVRAALVRRF